MCAPRHSALGVPLVLWQTWDDPRLVPLKVYEQAARLAPGHTHIVLGDADRRALIRRHCGVHGLRWYDEPKIRKAHRADAMRYALLFHYGGTYLDIDSITAASRTLVFCRASD